MPRRADIINASSGTSSLPLIISSERRQPRGKRCQDLAFASPTPVDPNRTLSSFPWDRPRWIPWNATPVTSSQRSPSTKKRDLRWKRTAYPRLPSLTHYVAVAQDAVEVIVFAREEDFAGRQLRSPDDAIELRPFGVSLSLAQIYLYRDTGLTA